MSPVTRRAASVSSRKITTTCAATAVQTEAGLRWVFTLSAKAKGEFANCIFHLEGFNVCESELTNSIDEEMDGHRSGEVNRLSGRICRRGKPDPACGVQPFLGQPMPQPTA